MTEPRDREQPDDPEADVDESPRSDPIPEDDLPDMGGEG